MRKRLALVSACCVVASAGCSDADETEPDEPGAEQSADQVDQTVTVPTDETATGLDISDSTDTIDEQADPAPTDQDFVSREEWAGYSWQGEGDPPPLPPVIRTVSQDERAEALAGCLIDAGFPVDMDADGRGFSFQAPEAQMEAYEEAHYVCYASYPLEPKYYQPYTDEQLVAWYEHLAGDTVGCLNELGYTGIDSPPSAEAWIENYRTGRGTSWWPFDVLPADQVDEIIATSCPLQPEGFFDMAATG